MTFKPSWSGGGGGAVIVPVTLPAVGALVNAGAGFVQLTPFATIPAALFAVGKTIRIRAGCHQIVTGAAGGVVGCNLGIRQGANYSFASALVSAFAAGNFYHELVWDLVLQPATVIQSLSIRRTRGAVVEDQLEPIGGNLGAPLVVGVDTEVVLAQIGDATTATYQVTARTATVEVMDT